MQGLEQALPPTEPVNRSSGMSKAHRIGDRVGSQALRQVLCGANEPTEAELP